MTGSNGRQNGQGQNGKGQNGKGQNGKADADAKGGRKRRNRKRRNRSNAKAQAEFWGDKDKLPSPATTSASPKTRPRSSARWDGHRCPGRSRHPRPTSPRCTAVPSAWPARSAAAGELIEPEDLLDD